jgi:hypothetical protein
MTSGSEPINCEAVVIHLNGDFFSLPSTGHIERCQVYLDKKGYS